jgi:hypothetical protein
MISTLSDWVSFLVYPNLFGIKSFVVVVYMLDIYHCTGYNKYFGNDNALHLFILGILLLN